MVAAFRENNRHRHETHDGIFDTPLKHEGIVCAAKIMIASRGMRSINEVVNRLDAALWFRRSAQSSRALQSRALHIVT